MNRLEKLIKEKCPNGVEYKSIKEICDVLKKGTLKTTELLDSGYPVVNSGRSLYGYYDQYNNDGNAFTVAARGEYAGYINYFSEKFWAGGLCYPYRSKSEQCFKTKFIYYYLKNIEKTIRKEIVADGSIPALNKTDLEKIIIPIPTIEVQEEIVRILDKFGELETELEAELEARRSQYEFWRGKLLRNNHYSTMKLGEVCLIKTGSKPKEILEFGSYEYINAGTTNSGYVDNANAAGDCVTTPSRGQGGIGYVGYQVNEFWCGPLCYQIRSVNESLMNKYLYYYMLSNNKCILGLKHEGGVPAVNIKELQEMLIIIPPIEEQRRIVNSLDKFDNLVNDINEGLPAEIELRRKQYEYYRNKLLSFEEL